MDIRSAVMRARLERSMTQKDLATAAGVSNTTVVNIEKGKNVTPRTAYAILSTLENNLTWQEIMDKYKLEV